jgi:hypothetical protein
MSQADARTFLERFAASDSLRRDVLKTLEGDAKAPFSGLVQLGAKQGLTFTVEEFAEAWPAWQGSGGAELSDRDLDGVAGGAMDLGILQLAVQKVNEMYQLLSNVQKQMSEQSSAIVKNIRG